MKQTKDEQIKDLTKRIIDYNRALSLAGEDLATHGRMWKIFSEASFSQQQEYVDIRRLMLFMSNDAERRSARLLGEVKP